MDTVDGCLGRAPLGGSVDTVDGWETVGNRWGRAALGGSETEAWTSWTDGKPWEIPWGELCWEEAAY